MPNHRPDPSERTAAQQLRLTYPGRLLSKVRDARSGPRFWIDPSQFGPQLATATASMLTLVAYRFALDNLLPKISYFTRMDSFITGSTLLVFLALAQAVTTSRLAHRSNPAVAVRIERISRGLFPALFVALVAYSFWF